MYERFEKLLIEKNLTAYRVARDNHITPSTFSDWKTGKSTPKVDKLIKIAKYLNVPLETFLKEDTADEQQGKEV